MIGTDGAQEPSRFVIAAHHQVLTVIDLLSRLFVGKGVRASPEMLRPFKDKHRQSARGKVDSCAQPAESTSDHNDISGHGNS